MRNRKAYDLKSFSICHNISLAIISLIIAVGIIEEIVRISVDSFSWSDFCAKTYCLPRGKKLTGPLYFWSYIFHCSKFYELIDSVIIILRKKHTGLTELHVFHHSIMTFSVLELFYGHMTFSWFAALLNSVIHVIMYSYYTLVLCGKRFKHREIITILQLIQFVTGASWLFSWLVGTQFFGWNCTGSVPATMGTILINISIFCLFVDFFINTYTRCKTSPSPQKITPKTKTEKPILAPVLVRHWDMDGQQVPLTLTLGLDEDDSSSSNGVSSRC